MPRIAPAPKIIASQHSATVELIQTEIPGWKNATVLSSVEKGSQLLGADVIGNLPLHLACFARRYFAVEFSLPVPRGSEIRTIEDLRRYGVMIVEYRVVRIRPLFVAVV